MAARASTPSGTPTPTPTFPPVDSDDELVDCASSVATTGTAVDEEGVEVEDEVGGVDVAEAALSGLSSRSEVSVTVTVTAPSKDVKVVTDCESVEDVEEMSVEKNVDVGVVLETV